MFSLEVDKSLQWALHKKNANGQKIGAECSVSSASMEI